MVTRLPFYGRWVTPVRRGRLLGPEKFSVKRVRDRCCVDYGQMGKMDVNTVTARGPGTGGWKQEQQAARSWE